MPGLQATYPVGGVVDKIKQLPPVDIRSMPSVQVTQLPGFPTKTYPYGKGFRIEVPAMPGVYETTYVLPREMELVSVAIACSAYADGDFWELDRDGHLLMETMYTKEVPEAHGMGAGSGVLLLPPGTILTLRFNNQSGTSKVVWFNLRFLCDPLPTP